MPRPRSKLEGQRFGRLIVLKIASSPGDRTKWLCRCDCGKERIVFDNNLKTGHTKSCGCLNKEKITKHGHSTRIQTSKTYQSWANMIQRCTNQKHNEYKNYGSRGIKVCKRWRSSFENFLKDMGEVPEGHQIDRINNDGNYCKSNCKWSTRKEQNRNSRNNHLITHKGKIQCLIEWSEEFDINYQTLYSRIFTLSWSIEKALTAPVQKRKQASV